MSAQHGMVAQLRQRIKDERVARTAFRLQCTDEAATDCLVAITRAGTFTTNVLNGRSAANLLLDLTAAEYRTVRQLLEYMQAQPGYVVTAEADIEPGHPSSDLEVVGSMSIISSAASFKHHLFSDSELLQVLTDACRRHNVSYSPHTVPDNEYVFVLQLAHAEIARQLAGDAAKRRNLDASSDQLLQLAQDLETAHRNDVTRQQRAIPVPRFDEDTTHQGDVVIGTFTKKSLRTGFYAPMAGGLPPSPAVLEAPEPDDVEDTKVILKWRRNTDLRFYAYELWRDTVPDIERPATVVSTSDPPHLQRDQVKLPFTAKLVFRSYGAHSSRDNVGWATFVEQSGQLLTKFVDDGTNGSPPLEPDTEYFYRMFISTLNYEFVGSNVVSVKTKSLRALMSATTPILPKEGPAGTPIAMTGSRFADGMAVTLGGKAAENLVIVSPTLATFDAPEFFNPSAINRYQDVVLRSANGLIDVLANGFKYTG